MHHNNDDFPSILDFVPISTLGGSASLETLIKNSDNIADFLENNRQHLLQKKPHEYLNDFLRKKKITIAEVVKNSLLAKSYVYEIFNGKKSPSRDKLIAIAFGLGLDYNETQNMLKWTHHKELYARDPRDAIILFSMQHKFNIQKTNDILDDYDFPPLGSFD